MTTTKRFRWLLFLILLPALSWPITVSAQQEVDGPSTPPSPEVAAPIYAGRCANCHGPAGRGDGPQAAQANLAMPDLTNPALLHTTTPARWFDIISNGVQGTAMPPFDEVGSNPLRQIDRWNLVFYLYTLGTPPAQVGMGQALYAMSCSECHGAAGDDFADLIKMADTSQMNLFAAIADTTVDGHDLGMGEVEIWTLADYVRTFSYNYAPVAVAETAPSSAPAASTPFTGGAGVVSGQVINGTSGGTAPAGLKVRLRAFDMDAAFVDAITTTVQADGAFRFEGIDPTAPVQMEPMVVYKGVSYLGDLASAIVLSPQQPEAITNITVYDTTEDAGAVRIERLHIVFDFAPGQTRVAELYILSNDGNRAYVGTLEEGTLRLTTPPNALNFQPAGDPDRYLSLADGVADTIPVPPGEGLAESILVYNMVYEGELELSRPMPYDVRVINVLVPEGVEVSGEGIRRGELFETQGNTFQTFLADDLSAGQRLTLRLSGEPETSSTATGSVAPSPQGQAGPDDTQSITIGAAILIGAIVIVYLYWQGRLNLRPATHNRQLVLLQSIADLDDDREAERVKEKPYQAQRAKLKQELVDLMERER